MMEMSRTLLMRKIVSKVITKRVAFLLSTIQIRLGLLILLLLMSRLKYLLN